MWLRGLVAKVIRGHHRRASRNGVQLAQFEYGKPGAGGKSEEPLSAPQWTKERGLPRVASGLFRSGSPLPARTGPLEVLRGRDVLVLCDVDNLSVGARHRGYEVLYGRLGELLCRSSRRCKLHAFFPASRGELRRSRYFQAMGWTPHMNEVQFVRTPQGLRRLSNSDNWILLWTGWLIARRRVEVVVVASGDGSLGCDIAQFLAGTGGSCLVVTLSLAGSTSCRLDARKNPYIGANLSLGRDALRAALPLGAARDEVVAAGRCVGHRPAKNSPDGLAWGAGWVRPRQCLSR